MPHKGYCPSEQTRAKLSEALKGGVSSMCGKKGVLHPFYGVHHSEEARVKISLSQRGRHHTEETKAKMSEAHKGKLAYNYGKHLSEEHKTNIRNAVKGELHYNYGEHPSEETKTKFSVIMKKRWQCPKYKRKRQETLRELWQDLRYKDIQVKRMRLGLRVHPNKPEMSLLALLNSTAPNEWAFVGDGQLIIAGKNPDFANINGKKQLVELWGDYWHKGEDPEDRISLFRQYGYDTLIIWERELRKPEKVLVKVSKFMRGSHGGDNVVATVVPK